jgi:UDP-N-acetylglucosamine-lysosomal-enzyme
LKSRHREHAVQMVSRAIELKQSINQSNNQSVSRSDDQSTKQVVDQSTKQAINALVNQSMADQSTDQSVNQIWPWELTNLTNTWDHTWGLIDQIRESINNETAIDLFMRMIRSNGQSSFTHSFHQRRLLDTYGSSLRYVNSLLHELYGKEVRKAPAHMPHFMDKRIMNELQSQWSTQYNTTSSNQFRTNADMQHAFAYFYYVIHARQSFNLTDLFQNRFDVDANGRLDYREIKSLALFVADALLNEMEITAVEDMLVNCSYTVYPDQVHNQVDETHGQSNSQSTTHSNDHSDNQSNGQSDELSDAQSSNQSTNLSIAIATIDVPLPLIDVRVLSQCSEIMPALIERVTSQPKYKHRIEPLHEVEFFMVPDNATIVARRLDQIAMKRPKFICLNDNMNKTSSTSPIDTLALLHEFYQTYFPLPSPFELPDGQTNGYRYIEDWRADQAKSINLADVSIGWSLLLLIVGCVVVIGCVLYMWPKHRTSKSSHPKGRSINRRGVTTSTIV